MIVFKPKLNLKTFVALALVFFGVGFVSIIAIGYGTGSKSSSTLIGSDAPLNTDTPASDETKAETKSTTDTNASGSSTTTSSNAGSNPTSTYTAAATTPSSPKGGSPSTGGTVTPAPAPAPTPTPTPAPAPTYCGGQTTCYGRADLAAHATSSSCWGYIDNVMYNVSSLIASHSGGSSPIRAVCGGNIKAALSAAPGNSKHSSALRNTAGSTLWGYKIGYYDAAKP